MLEWGDFRSDISGDTLFEQIEAIADYFKDVPIASRQLDYYTPGSWPSPWEILHYGQMCPSSVSLLMAYTLLLNGQADFKLLLIDDNIDYYLVPLIEGQYILNYILGEVVNLDTIRNDIKVKHTYNPSDLKDIY
jgi:hypothetical protein